MRKLLTFTTVILCLIAPLLHAQNGYKNPILPGFYSDPSVCRAGDVYYLVTSSFSYFPGVPIFHSKDLVNWEQIGHVLTSEEQLPLDGNGAISGISAGIFAPTLRYHEGVFYMITTNINLLKNFLVTATNPAGPWSVPIWIDLQGKFAIDPSLFFDDDGKTYLLFNSDAPDNKPLYNGHRTIRIREFDPINLKVSNEEKIIVNGGVDLSKKPVWIEGPHIYKVDGKYFLTAAEGGTAEDHSQVIFRSDNVFGPFIPYEKNPILTQRHLKPDRKNPVTCTGHADFVQNEKGDWWTVFLACRPHEPFIENNYNTGRETFLAPITWVDGWPVINYGFEEVQHYYPLPTNVKGKAKIPFSGDFTIKENFDASVLPNYFMFIKTPTENWYNLSSRKGFLEIKLRPETVSGKRNPSFIARRQQHSYCSFSTVMEFDAASENEKAGIIAFQMEEYFYYFCKSKIAGKDVLQLYKSNKDQMVYNMELLYQIEIDESKNLYLKIDASGNEYSFYYAFDKNDWKLFQNKVDASYLSPRNVYGFVGTVFGMYATSLGKQSRNKVYFDWLEYSGMDKLTN